MKTLLLPLALFALAGQAQADNVIVTDPNAVETSAKKEDPKKQDPPSEPTKIENIALTVGYALQTISSEDQSLLRHVFPFSVDYGLNDNLALGVRGGVNLLRRKSDDSKESGTESLSIGPNFSLDHALGRVDLYSKVDFADPTLFELENKRQRSVALGADAKARLNDRLSVSLGASAKLASNKTQKTFYAGLSREYVSGSFYAGIGNEDNFHGNNLTYANLGATGRVGDTKVHLEAMAGQRSGGSVNLGLPIADHVELGISAEGSIDRDEKDVNRLYFATTFTFK